MIVQGEDRFHVLPFTFFWRYAGTTIGRRICDELINNPETFRFVEGLFFQGLLCLTFWGGNSYTIDPVANSGAVDLTKQVLLGCYPREDENRLSIASPDFSS